MGKLSDCVLKHQTKGTQAVRIGDGYYLYKITSVRDPKKVTEKYLGTITPEGVIKSTGCKKTQIFDLQYIIMRYFHKFP